MKISHKFFLILLVSIVLRLSLVAINREANDPHWDVAQRIINTSTLPIKSDCWECYQPKLFHLIFAKFIQIMGLAGMPAYKMNIAGELINFIAGIITLVVFLVFIQKFPIRNDRLKLITFALFALNPPLIAINSQATNDSLAILFSTLALFTANLFIHKNSILTFILTIAFTVLGISSKTNVWVTGIAIALSFLFSSVLSQGINRRMMMYLIAFILLITSISVLNPLNQYIINTEKFGTPVLTNIPAEPFPHITIQTSAGKPGIRSIEEGFLFLGLSDLWLNPRIEHNDNGYPAFRNSFFTLLYGRSVSIHFDNWPPAWSTHSEMLFPLNRAILLLSLIPAIIVLSAFAIDTLAFSKCFKAKNITVLQEDQYGLWIFVFLGYAVFAVFYAILYRDYFVIKGIFIFPALLSMQYFFLKGGQLLYDQIEMKNKAIIKLFEVSMSILVLLYILDVGTLIFQLGLTFLRSRGILS